MRLANHLSDRIAAHAADFPGREALVFAADPDRPEQARVLTYAGLHDAARSMAVLLAEQVGPGDRALLLYPSGLEFGVAFLGCLYAGVLPIANPVPDGQRHRGERLAAIARNAGAAVLLTDTGSAAAVRDWAATGAAGLPVLVTDGPDRPSPALWRPVPADPGQIAFLQYTSGSTSDPRGVAVTTANLAANAEDYLRMLGVPRGARYGGWIPMHHDMGLIGFFLAPLYLGGTTVQMPASTFLRHPHSWLHMVDRFGLSVSAAPNFAYDMCVRRIRDDQVEGLDLSRWEVAANGSEPIRAGTMRDFVGRFAGHGLRPGALSPAYGLAEATLGVSCSVHGRPARITAVDAARLAAGEFRAAEPAEPAETAVRELVGCGPAG